MHIWQLDTTAVTIIFIDFGEEKVNLITAKFPTKENTKSNYLNSFIQIVNELKSFLGLAVSQFAHLHEASWHISLY